MIYQVSTVDKKPAVKDNEAMKSRDEKLAKLAEPRTEAQAQQAEDAAQRNFHPFRTVVHLIRQFIKRFIHQIRIQQNLILLRGQPS